MPADSFTPASPNQAWLTSFNGHAVVSRQSCDSVETMRAYRLAIPLALPFILLASAASLWGAGFLGPTAPLLCLGPIAAAVLRGTRWAVVASCVALGLVVGAAALHVTGVLPETLFPVNRSGPWMVTGAAFFLVAASAVTLISHLLRDLERVSSEFDEARKGLVVAGELRVADPEVLAFELIALNEQANSRSLMMRHDRPYALAAAAMRARLAAAGVGAEVIALLDL